MRSERDHMPRRIDDVVCMRSRRLYMRPVLKQDIPLLLRWVNDEEVNQYLSVVHPVHEAEEAEWIDRMHKEKNQNIVFAIVDAKTAKLIGTMGLHMIHWKE